jgi:hypothetical protein
MALTHHYTCKDGRFIHRSWLEGRQLVAFARLSGLFEEWSAAGLLDHARVRCDRVYSEKLRSALARCSRHVLPLNGWLSPIPRRTRRSA